MTLQNRDTTTFDRDDVFIAPDVELDEAELMLAEEDDELPKSSSSRVSERIVDDKYNKTLDATQIYLNEIGFSPLLSAEEEVFFARKALKGDEAARKSMIESNLRLGV
ncbi:MAG: sigma-70 factor domain-containing protein, partial [Pseudomonadota bacterium]|nr:sigma-70 factor domain-containing protein [Pseudomonadota bacterium]